MSGPVRSAARMEQTPLLGPRLAKAWSRHPLVTFARHRRHLAFYRQFHALLRAGLGMPIVFGDLARFAPDPSLSRALTIVGKDIEAGATLGEAMARHEALFDDVNVELIAFAEEAGRLDVVLPAIIRHMEDVHRLRWRTIFMSLWPAYLAIAFVFVGPLLDVARAQAPSGIGALYVGGLARNLFMTGLVGGLVLTAPLLIAALGLELEWDRLLRRLPWVSAPIRDLAASRFMLGLGLSLGAGLEAVRALRVSARATGSPSVQQRVGGAERALRSGASLTDAVASLELLDSTTLGSLAVAERTGTFDTTLAQVSAELAEASLRAARILMMVVIALVAGVLLVGIVSGLLGTILGPIKKLYDAAGSGNMDGL